LPRGYLTILVFNKDYVLVDAAWQQLDAAYTQAGPTKMPHQLLSRQVVIKEPGYAYVYLSNEGALQQDIYFDDLSIVHKKSPVVQSDEYFSFGLTFNSYYRESAISNQYLYNNGAERQNELGLEIDLTRFRTYDPSIGRWWQVDPLAHESDLVSSTPYNYSFNNPIRYNDPEGDCPCIAMPIIIEGASLIEGLVVAAAGATIGVTLKEYGREIFNAMSNASPYSTPAVDAAQSLGGASSLKNESKNDGKPDQEAMQRGRDNEKRVLEEEKLPKNNETKTSIDPKTGKETKVKPDGEDATRVGEVKDTKAVYDTKQIRGEREYARQQGKTFNIFVGEGTKVSKNIPKSEVVKKPYIGPQE
jgi:RHS repeat-associated protein